MELWLLAGVFQRPNKAKQKKVDNLILAAVALQSYLRQTGNTCTTLTGFVDSKNNRADLLMADICFNQVCLEVLNLFIIQGIRNELETREVLADYLVFEKEAVPWQ